MFRGKEILEMGIPTGIQNSLISISNVVIQSNINSFGSLAMAGIGTYTKIEGFAFLPITSFMMALTTFVSQNRGAKEYKRARKGLAPNENGNRKLSLQAMKVDAKREMLRRKGVVLA